MTKINSDEPMADKLKRAFETDEEDYRLMAEKAALNPYTKEGRAKLVESVKSRLGPTMRIEELTTAELLRIEERHGQLAMVLDRVKKAFPLE